MNALALTLQLLCTNPDFGTTIYVNAQVEGQAAYSVTLMNRHHEVMEMFRSEIRFDEVGSIREIEAHHWFENFEVSKSAEGWTGLYQYDLAYYPLTCIEK